jgi:hypothetical protein
MARKWYIDGCLLQYGVAKIVFTTKEEKLNSIG